MGIKIGRLDFKAHGLLGTAGLAAARRRALLQHGHRALPYHGINSSHDGLSMGSYALLGHAPEKTVIAHASPRLIARPISAASAVLYVNVRLAWACDLLDARLYGVACALLAARLTQQSSLITEHARFRCAHLLRAGLDGPAAALVGNECAWNAEVATLRTVPAVQFVALLVSFAFTLGFRGYIRLARLYALSAGAVAGILGALAGGGLVGAVAVGMISAFLLDRWIAARPPPDPKTLKTFTAVAKALEAEPAVRRNARSFAELGTEDVVKVTPPVESSVRPNPGPSASSARPRRSPRSRARCSRGRGAGSRRWTRRIGWSGGPHRRRPDAGRRPCASRWCPKPSRNIRRRSWARQALIVQRGNVEYAAKKLTKLAALRDRRGWAYRSHIDDRVAALRSDMHWCRRARTAADEGGGLQRPRYARVEGPRALTEVSVLVTGTDHAGRGRDVRRGVVVVADCSGLAVHAPKLSVVDARRGSDMVGDFPAACA